MFGMIRQKMVNYQTKETSINQQFISQRKLNIATKKDQIMKNLINFIPYVKKANLDAIFLFLLYVKDQNYRFIF